jgi:hypothetical protein
MMRFVLAIAFATMLASAAHAERLDPAYQRR